MDVADPSILLSLVAIALVFDFLTVCTTPPTRPQQSYRHKSCSRRRALGGVRQLHRFPVLRTAYRSNHRHGHHRSGRGLAARYLRGNDGRHCVERRHFVGFAFLRSALMPSSAHCWGAGLTTAGPGSIVWPGVIKATTAIVLAPATGFMASPRAGARRVVDLRGQYRLWR